MSYDRRQVEALIPAIWDDAYLIHGVQKEEVRDPEMPSGSAADPRRVNGHIVAIADVRRAWEKAGLTLKQQQATLLRFGMDMRWAEVAAELGRDSKTVREAAEGGVGRLVHWLNGTTDEPLEDVA